MASVTASITGRGGLGATGTVEVDESLGQGGIGGPDAGDVERHARDPSRRPGAGRVGPLGRWSVCAGVSYPWRGDEPTHATPRCSPTRRAAGLSPASRSAWRVLAGCSSEGASTDCGLDACTVTFEPDVDASATILGVEAKLVGAEGDQVTVEVAGEQLTLTVGQQAAQVGGFYGHAGQRHRPAGRSCVSAQSAQLTPGRAAAADVWKYSAPVD